VAPPSPEAMRAPSPPWPAIAPREWWRQSGSPIAGHPGAVVARVRPRNTHAVAALVFGIAGIVFLVAGAGLLFIFNLPCSVLAWSFGRAGMRRVDRGETAERRGMAQAGMILGIVGTVVGAVAIVSWALGFVFSDELRDQFRREWERQQNG
jgi:drug/metabolite transporter (DMT)-like permease